jgi:isopentenyl-diphosphate delta-isomerase
MQEERVILVDEAGQSLRDSTGRPVTAPKMEAHRAGRKHLAVSVFIFNPLQQLLLQQRADTKYHSPGLWSNSACTHPGIDEPPAAAAERRLKEEMGLQTVLHFVTTISYNLDVGGGLIENEFDHIFAGITADQPLLNPDEVRDYRWVDISSLDEELKHHPGQFTAWFRYLWPKVKEPLSRQPA